MVVGTIRLVSFVFIHGDDHSIMQILCNFTLFPAGYIEHMEHGVLTGTSDVGTSGPSSFQTSREWFDHSNKWYGLHNMKLTGERDSSAPFLALVPDSSAPSSASHSVSSPTVHDSSKSSAEFTGF